MKRVALSFLLLLALAVAAQAQTSVIPYVCTGAGPPGPCSANPVGSGATGAVPLPVTTAAPSPVTPVVGGSALSGLVLKNAPGNLLGVYAECTSACWLMVFNATAVPSNGSTTAGIASGNLVECVDVLANGSKSISYQGGAAEAFSVGISAAISSTACATLTLSTVGFIHGMVQ